MTAAVSSSSPSVPVQLPAPVAAPAPSQDAFAQMLKARQAEPVAPQKPTDSPKPEAPRLPSPSNANRAPARQPGRQPAEAGRPAADPARKVDDTEAAVSTDRKATDLVRDSETHPVDPVLVDWVANLNLPAEAGQVHAVPRGLPGADSAATPGEADPAGTALLPSGSDDKGGRLKSGSRLGLEQADATKAKALGEPRDTLHPGRETIEGGAAWHQEAAKALIEAPARPQEALRPEATVALAGLGAGPVATGRTTEPPPPVVVAMPTPVDSPDFPRALGAQLSMLAREGVQQAELHLNPADMGPISVQIELNGSQAHVNFGVDSAATRNIIESGLPGLAAALRDAGFTLSGGGVHQQAQQGQREGDADGRRGGAQSERGDRPEKAEVAAQARTHARVSAGGVDLYA